MSLPAPSRVMDVELPVGNQPGGGRAGFAEKIIGTGAGNDEGSDGFINQDTVRFVDNGGMESAEDEGVGGFGFDLAELLDQAAFRLSGMG